MRVGTTHQLSALSPRPPSSPVQPGLGEVLLSLLSALGAAQQLQRSAAALAPRQLPLGPWRGDGDAAPSSGA